MLDLHGRSRSRSRSSGLPAALQARADRALAEAKLRAAAQKVAIASDTANAANTLPAAGILRVSRSSQPCRDRSRSQRRSKAPQSTHSGSAVAHAEVEETLVCSGASSIAPTGPAGSFPIFTASVREPCRFFGSMRGCVRGAACCFSHDEPNSIELCRFLRDGDCLKGASCLYRHVQWTSVSEAEAHYGKRGVGPVLEAERAWNELHGHEPPHRHTTSGALRADAPAFVPLEKRYGGPAMNMMQKMGFELGRGLGRHEQGRLELVPSGPAPLRKTKAWGIGFEATFSDVEKLGA